MGLSTIYFIVSVQVGLPLGLIDSVCHVESHDNPAAIHRHDGHGDSLGLCQIKNFSARQVGFKGTEKDLLDPQVNALYAAKYLKSQIKRYKGDIQKAVTAYNKGHCDGNGYSIYYYKVEKYWKLHGTKTNVAQTKN